MQIRELARQVGVSAKTIRYYESIGLLPRAARAANNYRQYTAADLDQLRLIASARSLGLALDDIGEIMAARGQGLPPCQRVLDTLAQRLDEVDRHLARLRALRDALSELHAVGASLPLDDVAGEGCVCHLLKTYRLTGPDVLPEDGGGFHH